MKKLNQSFLALIVVFCALLADNALAQRNIAWTGATNNNWDTASNWNYPAITSVATFGANAAFVTLTTANNEIAIGDKVAGYGIPAGATITAIDAAKTKINISINTFLAVGTPGTNVVFTFAIPKIATAAPGILDIAVIGNGGNPTLAAGPYYFAGLTVSNESGPVSGSTLTIPNGIEIFVETTSNEGVLVKGGNIINNGLLDIKSSLSGGSNNTAGAYGMTFGLPSVLPTVATEYTYSGTGELAIDTNLGNTNSGGILFNGVNADANIATYKMLFNGTTSFNLSAASTGANPTANTHAMRFVGSTALRSCNVIIGGAGFTMGDATSGGVNGLLSIAGGGTVVTIAPETTINVYSNNSNPMNLIGSYIFGTNSISYLINKGTINFRGVMPKSAISLYTESNGKLELENQGTLNVDMSFTGTGAASILVVGFNNVQVPNRCFVTVINKGTMNLKSLLNGLGAGHAIFAANATATPSFSLNNSGTLNIIASAYTFGGRPFNVDTGTPPVLLQDAIGSVIYNSGIINTNQEFTRFYTENSSTGTINFKSTSESPFKLATFTVPATTNATVGTTYTDELGNVHTVQLTKVGTTTTTSLITHFSSTAVNPPTRAAAPGPPEVFASTLIKSGSGAGDSSIVFTGLTTNNDNAFFQRTLNSGTINTNAGTRAMTGINGVTTVASTSVLSPGGDNGNSLATLGDSASNAFNLLGTLKVQATGNTTPGIDFDKFVFPGSLDVIDISQTTLDVTNIYTPTEVTTIDIITAFDDTTVPYDDLTNKSGAIKNGGPFASVLGIPAGSGWEVVYTTLPGKVTLAFDPAKLSTADNAFSKFKFNYYPNPTSNQINLSADKTISKVELYNVLGQKVHSNAVNATQKQLSIAHLQKGVYFMEVNIDNAKKSFKIVKQ